MQASTWGIPEYDKSLEAAPSGPSHHRLQHLVRAEPPPDPAAVTEHHAEQPDLALDVRLGRERDRELGKVHLRLLAGARLEPPLERPRWQETDQPQVFRQRGISTLISYRPQLAVQPAPREAREDLEALGKIAPEPVGQPLARFPGP